MWLFAQEASLDAFVIAYTNELCVRRRWKDTIRGMGIEAMVDVVISDCATLHVRLGEWMGALSGSTCRFVAIFELCLITGVGCRCLDAAEAEQERSLARCRERLAPMNVCAQLLSCDATQFVSQAIAQLSETGAHGVTLARQILVARGDPNHDELAAALEEDIGSQDQGNGGAFEWLEKMTSVPSS